MYSAVAFNPRTGCVQMSGDPSAPFDVEAQNRRLQRALDTVLRCRELGPCLDPGKVYPVALDILLDVLERPRGIAVFRRTGIPLGDGVAFRGLSEAESGPLREALVDDKPVDFERFESSARVDRGELHDALRSCGVEAGPLLVVPLRGSEGEVGLLAVLEDGRGLDVDDLAQAELVQGFATTALENAERYERAKERAFIDDVTEVYNARYLHSASESEIRRADRYGHALSVLFLDLDRFKLVNDRYGHLIGSQTLRSLSRVLLDCVRQVDTLARYGGDEFTILLPDTDHDGALAVGERIRRTIEAHRFEAGREGTLQLTISIGVATFPQHGGAREALLDAADKAMYRAKSRGRNRVCSASELEP